MTTNAKDADSTSNDATTSISWRDVIRESRSHMERDRITVSAGAFAYRWFLSIFPAIIALLGFASLVGMPSSLAVNLIHGAERALPSGAAQVFATAINQATHRTSANLVATLVALSSHSGVPSPGW